MQNELVAAMGTPPEGPPEGAQAGVRSLERLRKRAASFRQLLDEAQNSTCCRERTLQDARKELIATNAKLQELKESGGVASLNVGGVHYDVPFATLLRDEGSLFSILLGSDYPIERDASGSILIDRDGLSFRHVLNYLRGYPKSASLSSDELALLLSDADYFVLPQLRKMLSADDPQAGTFRFESGPGVSPECNRIRVAYCVGVIGEKFLIAGRHRVNIEVRSGDYVGIGVVSDACVCFDQEFHRIFNSAVYYMTGVFYSNFPHNRKEEGLEKYGAGDVITMVLDMDDKTIEFSMAGKGSKVVSCATASKLKFAVVTKMHSQLRILSDAEASLVAASRLQAIQTSQPAANSGGAA